MRCDAVALRVQVVADLDRVARLLLIVELVHRRLEQKRIAAFRVAHLFVYCQTNSTTSITRVEPILPVITRSNHLSDAYYKKAKTKVVWQTAESLWL